MNDSVLPFIFESFPVRGALVQLENTWQRMQQDHSYASPVSEVLGHAAAATSLIARSLKFEGSVTLQISSNGPLGTLVMQSTDGLSLRGMSTAADVADGISFADLVTGARCAVTIDTGSTERPYQGIVEIRPESLAASLENYFAKSVQVLSHLALISCDAFCGGILLQQMPGDLPISKDDWSRLGYLAATLRLVGIDNGATPGLLHRLFPEDDIRVFEPATARFQCRCSQAKVEDVLRFLGESETRAALVETGQVDVTCEYCGKVRSFDAVDVSRVFSDLVIKGSSALH